jgi:DNA mismatch repair protein MutL
MPIQVLSELVAAQIAAGEVIERPASAVKELVENALDAGATVIQVESEGGGRRMIRVADNGSGIQAAEVELAFIRHATSKLTTVEDLYQISTLGFRGEALASIAAVSQLTLLTRTADAPTGIQLRMRAGAITEKQSAGAPIGTVITIENLFFNTPARLRFLKAETTERRHIDTIITRYAMAYPNVRFLLKQDGRLVFQTTGNGSLADVLVETLGLEVMRDMLEVTPVEPRRADLPRITVSGFSSAPHLTRNTRSQIQLFVNGRAIQDSSLSYAVAQAYHTLIPSDRYPIAVLLINLPPEDVDVNVHPTKAEVRFRSADAVFSAVQTAVRRAVVGSTPVTNATYGIFEDSRTGSQAPAESIAPDPYQDSVQASFSESIREAGFRTQQYPQGAPYRPGSAPAYRPGADDMRRYDGTRRSSAEGTYPPPTDDDHADGAGEAPIHYALTDPSPMPPNRPVTQPPPYATNASARKLPPMRVVGQVAATYIVAEGPAGMYLIDQHAAHERILYEQFMAEHAAKARVSQRTLDGIQIQVTLRSAAMLAENAAMLSTLGFVITPLGDTIIRVDAVPAIIADRTPEETLRLILDDLEDGSEPGARTVEAKITLRVCKAAAVKAGQILSLVEMQNMIRMLEACQNPRTCPHGRPTLVHLSSDQLAKEFGRL